MSNCVFKKVSRMPVSALKDTDASDLEELLNKLTTERKEVERTIKWVEAIIKIKSIERGE